MAAASGLQPAPVYGPYGERYALSTTGRLNGPGQPLLAVADKSPIEYRIQVDSLGVSYQRFVSGFPESARSFLGLSEYLQLEYRHARQQRWNAQIRRQFRAATMQQLRDDKTRFQWTVPFPESRTLRRIIGEEGPTLSLNGERTITLSGKSEWTAGEVQTLAGRASKFPSLSMQQDSRFSVEGRVGELINLRINQDTQSLGSAFSSSLADQLANQIRLDYKGDEDAIFQEVQAGNTTLDLPATRFVGFRQQQKGLFGVRTKGRLGPLSFTAIASHEKSKSNRQTFRGGASVDTTNIRDYEYLRNTYFFLDESYRRALPDYRKVVEGTAVRPEDFIDPASLEIYVNDFNTYNDAETLAREGVAWADLNDRREASGWVEQGTWHRLDPDNEYTLVAELGYIVLQRSLPDRHALAVIYRTQGGEWFGSRDQEPMLLKLIKARDARAGFPTWELSWKNVYRIGSSYRPGRQFDLNTLDVQIFREIPGREPELSHSGRPYLQLMGLDLRGQDPNSPPDRLIDKDYIGLDEFRGHLIFPDQKPFNPQDEIYQILPDTIPEIYTSQQQRDLVEASRYFIQVRSSSSEQRISLGGILGGVRTETVEVRLNNRQLQRGADYNVDFIGNVTFLGSVVQEVNDPGADLEISYESEDIFGLSSQQKTLLGMRTEYEFWSGDGRLGSTLIYSNERTSDRRVRVGSEPSRTVIWNLDFKARRPAPLLTRMVDALPLLKTAAPSEILLEAELAQSRPNLNTREIGYIDDFEGSERPISLSVRRTNWTPASVPPKAFHAQLESANRARLIWYNPYDGVLRTDIWPSQEEQVDVQNKQTDVLTLELMPALPRLPVDQRPGLPDPQATSWDGVMTAFAGVNDFSQAKFLEIWIRGDQGQLQISLGSISEDVNGNNILDTEDQPLPGRTTGDGVVSREEDVGLDGRNDLEELDYYLELAGADLDGLSVEQKKQLFQHYYPERDPDDPEGDNWHYDPVRSRHDYSRINGTEGNRIDPESGTRPDTEDINNDGVLNTRNDYYHYTIDLANDPHVPETESDPGKPLGEVWRMFRLPLFGDAVKRVGNPDSTRIEFARLLLAGSMPTFTDYRQPDPDPLTVQIALIEVVQNEWQEDALIVLDDRYPIGADEGLNVTVIGTDKSLSYQPPPGVKVRRNASSRTREREQSLVLAYNQLEPGHQVSATKILGRPTNYTQYRRLRMYVHGEENEVGYVRGDSSDLELFVRFGSDSANYYEFIGQVFPGWEGGRSGWRGNEVDIELLEISQLKSMLQSGRLDLATRPLVYVVLDPREAPVESMARLTPEEFQQLRERGFDPQVALEMEVVHSNRRDGEPARYRVRGNPSMQQIRQLTVGLRNRGEVQRHSGQVYVNELRLEDARNDPGMAAYLRVNTQLADFANLDSYVELKEENFRTPTGEGGNSRDLATNLHTSMQLHQLLPGSWAFSIPLRLQFRNEVSLPRFGPNADVELTGVEKDSLRSEFRREYFDVSISRRQGNSRLLRWTIDQLNLRLSHSFEQRSSPVRPLSDQKVQTMSLSYRMPLPAASLGLFGWMPEFVPTTVRNMELRYLPSNLSYSMNANRREQLSFQTTDIDPVTGRADTTFQENFRLNENYALKLNPLTGVAADYDLRVERDLRKNFVPGELSFGREVGRNQKADVNFNLRFISWLDQNYTFTATYQETNDPNRRQAQAMVDSITGRALQTRDIDTQNDLSARFNLRLPALLKSLGSPGLDGSRSPHGAMARPSPQGSAADSGQRQASPEEAKEKSPGKPFLGRRLLHFSSDYVEPFTATWRRNTNTRNFNLIERPSLLFQLGLDDSLRVPKAVRGLTQQDVWSQTSTVELGSGLRLPMGVSLKLNANDRLDRRSGSSQTRLRVRKERRFPRFNLTWSRADRIPYIKRFVNSAQVNASFDWTEHTEGEGSLAPRHRITQGAGREFRISWNGRWRFGPSTNIQQVYSASTERNYDLLTQSTSALERPPLRGTSSQEKTSTTVTVRHNLRPRDLPLFGQLKSDIDLRLEVGFESESRSSATGDARRTPITANDRWRTSLTTSYRFSEHFRGEGIVRLENNHNRLTDKIRKIREVRLSGTFFLR